MPAVTTAHKTNKWRIRLTARPHVYFVKSPSGADGYYVFPRELRCTCPGWQSSLRAHGRHDASCKHLTTAINYELALERAARPQPTKGVEYATA